MNSQPEGDVGRNRCGICYQQMTNYGPSQVVCLKCGHVFCSRCIGMSLRVRKQCPVCYAPAKNTDVRLLYCDNMVIRDEAAIADLRQKLEKEEFLRKRTEDKLIQAEAKIQSLSRTLQKVISSSAETGIALSQILEEMSYHGDESDDVLNLSDENPGNGELKFHFLSHIACGNASFLTPNESCSSIYFAQSPNRESSSLSRLSSVDTERGTVVSLLTFPQSHITGIEKFPLNPNLLLSCESQQHIFDPRSNSIVWTSQFASPVTATCPSSSPFQFFTATSDALFEGDYRGCSPVSILATSDGTIRSLFSPFPQSLFYTLQKKYFQGGNVTSLTDVSDSWTQTGKLKVKWNGQETWGVATEGITDSGELLLGIAHTSGIDVVFGRQRQMLWDYEMKARIEWRREEGAPIRPAFFHRDNVANCVCVCGDRTISLFNIDAHPCEMGSLDGSSLGRFNDEILLSSQDVLAHVLATSEGIYVHQLVWHVCSY